MSAPTSCPTDVDLLKRLLLDVAQERSIVNVLKLIVNRMASQPEVALARVWLSKFGRGRLAFFLAESRREDLVHMGELFGAGKVTPVIDRTYPLCDAGEALRRVGEKQGIGKVIIIP